jgi:nucleotide-binding universal stress UspA family protein
MKTNKILIPLDGSETAEAAITEAREIAKADSTLVLVRAVNARIIPGADVTSEQGIAVREAEEYLAALKDKLGKAGARGVETHVWYGPAAPAVVEAARANKVDLIVMTTHGRSEMRLVFGSVAESVLRGTTVPILLVRPGGAPIEAPASPGEVKPAMSGESTRGAEVLR